MQNLEKMAIKYFKYYNKFLFENKLPEAKIKIKDLTGFMPIETCGYFSPIARPDKLLTNWHKSHGEIVISNILTKNELKNTLLHEMVHYYIYMNDLHTEKNDCHDPPFSNELIKRKELLNSPTTKEK